MQFIDLKTQYQLMRSDIDSRMSAVLEHGRYILGPEVKELEQALADRIGAAECITVASGTEALLISLMALGVGRGDEVIVPPFTFAATAEMVVLLGATPVFVDVDALTCNIDTRLIDAAITTRTKAIIPVSLYGQPADFDAINAIAAKHGNIPVIDDAAQSLGATLRGRQCGTFSTLTCASFFPSKPLGCYGDGGAVFTDDANLAQACREIRTHGQSARYTHTRIGVGGRMDTLQCAVLLAKLPYFDQELAQRNTIAKRYLSNLAQNQQLSAVGVQDDRTSTWAQFTVVAEHREQLIEQLTQQDIPYAIHYPKSLHQQVAYQEFSATATCPVSEHLADRVLSLPMSPYLTPADQDRVLNAVNAFSNSQVTV